ncbi:ankyrin repeat-containing domain protein [Baffinella frigidus]|nr:ankyrin repeat-containing domain protein [Cryptophyta sp. CCMP2293]
MAAATPELDPALWTASSRGRTEDVRRLLAGGADTQERGGTRRTSPLHCSSIHGCLFVSRLLLQYGAEVSSKDLDGNTPLHCAAQNGNIEVVLLLLEDGADLAAKDKAGKTPLQNARQSGHSAMVNLESQTPNPKP